MLLSVANGDCDDVERQRDGPRYVPVKNGPTEALPSAKRRIFSSSLGSVPRLRLEANGGLLG